jgi:hypothetical protein
MGYKGIRLVGFLSALMMLLLLGATIWEAFGGTERPAPSPSSQGVWMAFFFLSLLATRVGSILEVQADEIANLKRSLEEQRVAAIDASSRREVTV